MSVEVDVDGKGPMTLECRLVYRLESRKRGRREEGPEGLGSSRTST